MNSAICGGLISKSFWDNAMKEDNGNGYMMCWVLPDKQYKKYERLTKEGQRKEAAAIVKKHAWSII